MLFAGPDEMLVGPHEWVEVGYWLPNVPLPGRVFGVEFEVRRVLLPQLRTVDAQPIQLLIKCQFARGRHLLGQCTPMPPCDAGIVQRCGDVSQGSVVGKERRHDFAPRGAFARSAGFAIAFAVGVGFGFDCGLFGFGVVIGIGIRIIPWSRFARSVWCSC